MSDDVRPYRGVVVTGPFAEAKRRDFRRLERALGTRLPGEYRRFMEVANGGSLPGYAVDLPPGGGGEPIELSELFTVTRDARGGFGWGTVRGEWEHRPAALPPDLVPVARDGGDSLLFLRTAPAHHGEVWAFVHGLPAWAGPASEQDAFGPVAASFDAYLDLLYAVD